MDYTRQLDLVIMNKLQKLSATIIGIGAIGSFTALTLTKMGLQKVEVFDEDGVSDHNLPNSFYRKQDITKFKADALFQIIEDFSDVIIRGYKKFYTKEKLNQIVIVVTDSMHSRKRVWEQFKKQKQCKYYIEARMGAQLGIVYTIKTKKKQDIDFYEKTLYSDKKVKPLKCTAKTIIYNVLMISSLICRAFASIVNNEKIVREMVFNMKDINRASFLVRE